MLGFWTVDHEATSRENSSLPGDVRAGLEQNLQTNPFELQITDTLYISRSRKEVILDRYEALQRDNDTVAVSLVSILHPDAAAGRGAILKFRGDALLITTTEATIVMKRSPSSSYVPSGTILSQHDNGIPERLLLPQDWQAPWGAVIQGGTEVELHETGELKRFLLGARDWTIPAGPVIKAGTVVELYENARTSRFTLAQDFGARNGMILARGTEVEQYPDGYFLQLTLAADWVDPGPGGITFRAGTEVTFHEKGKFRTASLAKKWAMGDGQVLQRDSRVEFSASGLILRYTLAQDWENSDGMVLLAGEEVAIHPDGGFKRFTLAQDWRSPRGDILQGGSGVTLYPNGTLHSFTLAYGRVLPDGAHFKAGSVVELHEDDSVKRFVLARDFPTGSGAVIKADTPVEIPEKDSARFTLARDWLHGSTCVLKAETLVDSVNSGERIAGTLARECRTQSGIFAGGTAVAIVAQPGGYLISPVENGKPAAVPGKRAGIHVIMRDSQQEAESTAETSAFLSDHGGRDYHRWFADAGELDPRISAMLEHLEPGEISRPFEFNGRYLVIQSLR